MIVLAGLFYQVESLPANRSTAQENQSANSQFSPPAVEKPLSDHQATPSQGNAEPTSDNIKKAEWVQIGINTFIALVIFWQAWLYRQQSDMVKSQMWQTYLTERAYIALVSIEVNDLIENRRPYFHYSFVDGGKTPAWNFTSQITWNIGPSPVIQEWDKSRGESPSFMAAGQIHKGSGPARQTLTRGMYGSLKMARWHSLFRSIVGIWTIKTLSAKRGFPVGTFPRNAGLSGTSKHKLGPSPIRIAKTQPQNRSTMYL